MRFIFFLFLFYLFLGLSGCAYFVRGPSFDEAPKPKLTTENIAVYFSRGGMLAFRSPLHINGKHALDLGNGFTWFELRPGIYNFQINGAGGVEALKFDKKFEIPGKVYYLNCNVSGLGTGCDELEEKTALKYFKSKKYMQPSFKTIEPKIELE
ncbi:MAG: hypothetical protein OEY38_13410 [Gammaproteobacteria bacterium]|nr:hypothetical protein [Gammaproteobacteria bacterium]